MELSAAEWVVKISLGVCGEKQVTTWLCSSDLFYTSALEQDDALKCLVLCIVYISLG